LAVEAPLSTRLADNAGSISVNVDGLADFFDRACTELLAMEEASQFASGLSVHPRTYELLASLREREVSDGYGLVILGLPVKKNSALSPGDFHVVSETR
jgi:Ni,Fe-hydrogenase III component G